MASEAKTLIGLKQDTQTGQGAPDPSKRGLVVKLCEVMQEAGYVQKRGHNERFNYNYATEADVVDLLREKLALRHVFVFPSVISANRTFHSKTSSGAETHITEIMVKWTFLDGETGETQECIMPGCGTDTGDKGIYKAITGSSKYLFLKAFMLPTGDDPEDEKVDREEGKAAAREVAKNKLKAHANGDESVVLTNWKEGQVALSGNGLAIIKAALSEAEKRDLGIVLDPRENVVHLPAAKGFQFVDACQKHQVPTIWVDSPPRKPLTLTQQLTGSLDPKIEAAEIVKVGGKVKSPFLRVKWNGKSLSCFATVNKEPMKPLWDLVIANIGKPADFIIKENGAYSNIEGIRRLNGRDFEAENKALNEGTLEPDFYLEPMEDGL